MELQAIFAIVILCGEGPSGLLSDLWGKKKTLLVGSALKATSFSLLPLWSSARFQVLPDLSRLGTSTIRRIATLAAAASRSPRALECGGAFPWASVSG